MAKANLGAGGTLRAVILLFALIGVWFVGYAFSLSWLLFLIAFLYITVKSIRGYRMDSAREYSPRKIIQLVALIFAVIIGFALITDVLVIIPPGFVGVVYNAGSGVNMDAVRNPGWSLKWPIIQKIYMVQTSRDTINFYPSGNYGNAAPADDIPLSVPSSDGLIVKIDVSVMYKTRADKAPYIIQNLGEYYRSDTLMPEIRSVLREVTGTMKAEELYGPGREKLQTQAFGLLEKKFARDGFLLEDVLVRDIDLPDEFLKSIESKKIMEQDAIRKQNELKLAEYEANRMKLEAEGLANYKIEVARGDAEALRLVAKVLEENPKVLDFKKLEITEKLYENPNTRFVALPSNEMILSLPADVMSSEV